MNDTTITLPALEEGQLWTLSNGFLKVVGVDEGYVEYKLLHKPEHKGAQTRKESMETIQRFLTEKKAVLG